MSGEELRKAASDGNAEHVKEYIEKRCNPCSVDEYGLSALHYAVWNGHIECVKLLVCNTLGVDLHGIRTSSMELMSCMGFTGDNYSSSVYVSPHLYSFYTVSSL
jgi:ankyrin repeat protein